VSGTLARFELSTKARRRSACEDLTAHTRRPPPRPRASAAPCWPIRRRSWSREHRASCGTRLRGPSGPRARASASSAALRSRTRRASATFKRGAPQGPRERRPRWHFSQGRLPRVNWGSIYIVSNRLPARRDASMLGRRLGPLAGRFDALPLLGRLVRRLASEARPGKSAGRATSAGRAYLARNAVREGVRATSTGLQYRVLRSGAADAEQPTASSSCECHYRGRLLDGVEFVSMSKVAEPSASSLVAWSFVQPRPTSQLGRIHAGPPHLGLSST
jgi:hypothetical protein